jgi:hypothetical protein
MWGHERRRRRRFSESTRHPRLSVRREAGHLRVRDIGLVVSHDGTIRKGCTSAGTRTNRRILWNVGLRHRCEWLCRYRTWWVHRGGYWIMGWGTAMCAQLHLVIRYYCWIGLAWVRDRRLDGTTLKHQCAPFQRSIHRTWRTECRRHSRI